MKKYSIVLLGIFMVLFCACKDDENGGKPILNNFNDKEMIISVVEKIIKPEEEKLYADAVVLKANVKAFEENITPENLEKLKTQWLVVAKDWARCYTFNIGDVKAKRLFFYINNFPVATESLENKINTTKEITSDYVLKMGADTKGLFALEYLFFKDNVEQTITDFSASENRKKMLMLITDELLIDIENHKKEWGKLAPEFIKNDEGRESISNSFNMLFNGVNNVIHYAWETKVGKPGGLVKKKIGPNPSIVEALYSKNSLELIKENIAMTKKLYFSDDFISISDKVKFVTKNDQINNAVKVRYEKIETAIAAIENPLSVAVKSEREKVKTLFNELKLLEGVELSTDVKSALSLIITGTDGDGD